MSAAGGFVSEMRRQADLAVLWWTTKWGGLALLVVAWGVLILAQSEDNKLPWGVGTLLVGVVGLAYVARHTWQTRTPSGHPLDVELAAFGDAAVVRSIDADFSGKPFATRRVHVGRGWVCYVGKGQVTIRRLDALVWAYIIRVTHKLNGIIPYRVSNHLMLWGRDGTAVAISGNKSALEKTMTELRSSAPWLALGYSEALKESWNADQREFIAYVEAQRMRAEGERAAKP